MKHSLKTFEAACALPPFNATGRSDALHIDLAERSYDICLGNGTLAHAANWQGLPRARSALIVTNTTVQPLYGASLQQAIAPHFERVHTVVLPDGEQYKTWESLNLIFDALLAQQCDRKTVLFALGGGVVGDKIGRAHV